MSLPDINAADGSVVRIVLLSMCFGSPQEDDYFDSVEEALRAGVGMVDWNTAAPCGIIVDGEIKYTRNGETIDGYEGVWCRPIDDSDTEFIRKHWPEQLRKEITDGRSGTSA